MVVLRFSFLFFSFFFNDTATTEIYTLSLHDASSDLKNGTDEKFDVILCSHTLGATPKCGDRKSGSAGMPRPISYAGFWLEKKTTRHKLSYYRGAIQGESCGRQLCTQSQ